MKRLIKNSAIISAFIAVTSPLSSSAQATEPTAKSERDYSRTLAWIFAKTIQDPKGGNKVIFYPRLEDYMGATPYLKDRTDARPGAGTYETDSSKCIKFADFVGAFAGFAAGNDKAASMDIDEPWVTGAVFTRAGTDCVGKIILIKRKSMWDLGNPSFEWQPHTLDEIMHSWLRQRFVDIVKIYSVPQASKHLQWIASRQDLPQFPQLRSIRVRFDDAPGACVPLVSYYPTLSLAPASWRFAGALISKKGGVIVFPSIRDQNCIREIRFGSNVLKP